MNEQSLETVASAVRPILNTDEASLFGWIAAGWGDKDDFAPDLNAWRDAAQATMRETNAYAIEVAEAAEILGC